MEYALSKRCSLIFTYRAERAQSVPGRIRVLRDVGVPAVHKPGKGSKVDYDFGRLLETHVP